jgi:hypothetical protein
MENVTPAAFAATWETSMKDWGTQIQGAVEGVSRMLAVGLGIDCETFIDAGKYGPHLLAPTATDLDKYGRVGESKALPSCLVRAHPTLNLVSPVFAGFHTDLNFLTIHGRSRYPVRLVRLVSPYLFAEFSFLQGLHIWGRNSGKRITVKLPPGHLLVQAGKQLESVPSPFSFHRQLRRLTPFSRRHLTNGLILAGYHEVVCTPETVAAIQARQSNPATASRPTVRISSTFFWHLSRCVAPRLLSLGSKD